MIWWGDPHCGRGRIKGSRLEHTTVLACFGVKVKIHYGGARIGYTGYTHTCSLAALENPFNSEQLFRGNRDLDRKVTALIPPPLVEAGPRVSDLPPVST